jgi:aspartyl-tRNA(Asn)/glutamyl-tRNA(Gln) amidotransferase subunit A
VSGGVATLAEAAALVRTRLVSAVELVREALDEIAAHDSVLNSFVAVDPGAALARADTLDRELAAGEWRGPLHGIPMSLKDNIDTEALVTASGSPLFRGRVPAHDAAAWRNLSAAGAVLIGKNNLWELALGGPHPDFGPTWNPWDPTRTAGGTSGGSAAAVAAGLVYASLGTDTGGSARVPAALCGVVALKPTHGRVPLAGVLPVSSSMDHVCPIARTAEDTALVLAGALSTGVRATFRAAELAGRRLGVIRPINADALAPHVRESFERALALFVENDVQVVDVVPPDLDSAVTAGRLVFEVDAASFHRVHARDHADLLGETTLTRLRSAALVSAADYVDAQRACREAAHELDELLRSVDALVLPAVTDTAYVVDANGFEPGTSGPPRISGRFMLPFDATGHPAVVVPAELAPNGLPTAIQLVGRLGDDDGLLAIAAAYEQARGPFPRPPRPS